MKDMLASILLRSEIEEIARQCDKRAPNAICLDEIGFRLGWIAYHDGKSFWALRNIC